MTVRLSVLTGLGACFALSVSSSLYAQRPATIGSAVASSEAVSFEVYLPQTHKRELKQLLTDQQTPGSAHFHQWLTPEQFESRFGPSPATLSAVEDELTAKGLHYNLITPQLLEVTGTAAAVSATLDTKLAHAVNRRGEPVIMATKPITTPPAIADNAGVVTGLSGVVRMRVHSRIRPKPANRYTNVGPYWFDDLKQAYAFPSYTSYAGRGATIGVLISSDFNQSDMDAYFGNEGLPSPKITVRKIAGGAPFDPKSESSAEAELDIEQSGGMAPEAKIVVYDIPSLSDRYVLRGLNRIVNDNKVDVVNMSFGAAEVLYTGRYNNGEDFTALLYAEDEAMAQGNAQGITFVASSGDYGGAPVPEPGCFVTGVTKCGGYVPSAEFPASSPHVVGVGGTNLVTRSRENSSSSAYVSEEAFGDPLTEDIVYDTPAKGGSWGSGGGDSILFEQPDFQRLVDTGNAHARTVPDVAYHMGGCPGGATGGLAICNADDSADIEIFGGYYYESIGTSASSPDFVGLTALNVERWGSRVGNENLYLYTLSAAQSAGLPFKVFHWDVPGFNGVYHSGNHGYNRVLGNGTIKGKDFLLAPLAPSAGDPGTASNP